MIADFGVACVNKPRFHLENNIWEGFLPIPCVNQPELQIIPKLPRCSCFWLKYWCGRWCRTSWFQQRPIHVHVEHYERRSANFNFSLNLEGFGPSGTPWGQGSIQLEDRRKRCCVRIHEWLWSRRHPHASSSSYSPIEWILGWHPGKKGSTSPMFLMVPRSSLCPCTILWIFGSSPHRHYQRLK